METERGARRNNPVLPPQEMKTFLIIDVGGTSIKIHLLYEEKKGQLKVKREIFPTKKAENVNRLIEHIRNFFHKYPLPDTVILGIPGEYDHKKDTLLTSPNIPAWKNLELKDTLIKGGLGRKIIVENDVNLQTLGELEKGYGKKWMNFIFLAIGTGIGSGIVIDGKLVRGSGGGAGEIGHILIHPEGEMCGCGRRGCLEAYASGSGIVKSYKRLGGKKDVKTSEEVYTLAVEGDETAVKAFEIMGRYLGWGIASVVNILEPEGIVLSGGVTESRDLFEKKMVEAFKERTFTHQGRNTPIKFSLLKSHALWGGINILKKEGKIPSLVSITLSW